MTITSKKNLKTLDSSISNLIYISIGVLTIIDFNNYIYNYFQNIIIIMIVLLPYYLIIFSKTHYDFIFNYLCLGNYFFLFKSCLFIYDSSLIFGDISMSWFFYNIKYLIIYNMISLLAINVFLLFTYEVKKAFVIKISIINYGYLSLIFLFWLYNYFYFGF